MSHPVSYLLDTNVLSETRKRSPDPNVLAFLARADPSALYISVLTLGELRKGIVRKQLSDSSAAASIAGWVDGLELSYADRILGIDAPTARLWGEWSAQRPRSVVDTLLAATAVTHGLTLVTRNTADVEDIEVRVYNPFSS